MDFRYITGHLVLLKDMLQVKLEDLLTTKETQKCILIIQHHFLETPSIEKLPKEGVAASLEILLLLHKVTIHSAFCKPMVME